MNMLKGRNRRASVEPTENRLDVVDFIRGLVMILVVLDHSGFPYRKMILGFHMPILFILSGFLNYLKDFAGGVSREKNSWTMPGDSAKSY